MKFLSEILVKAGLVVDGVAKFNSAGSLAGGVSAETTGRLQVNSGVANNYADLKAKLFISVNGFYAERAGNTVLGLNNTAGGKGWYIASLGSSNADPGSIMFNNETDGLSPVSINNSSLKLKVDTGIRWTEVSSTDSVTYTAGISVDAANRLQINTGTDGVYGDLKLNELIATSLVGSGTRMVVADTNGLLSTQAIPSVPVLSVFGRTGNVTAQSGDYTTAQVTESGNLYYTDVRARGAVSASGSLSYNSTTGVFSYTTPNTDGVSEGATNLYFTNARSRAALSFVAGSGGYNSTTGVITIPTDNNQIGNSAGYITTISGIAAGGELSGTYPNPTLVTSAVTGKVLSGLNLTGGGTITASDSILSAFGKIQNQISAMVGGVMYQGTWNASTNIPSLTSSVGTKGHYYIVSVAGSTNLDGVTNWNVGDWAIFNGATWDKVDNTDAVSSVNGFTGAVSLTTAHIAESGNLYYTEARVSANADVAANTAARHAAVTIATANGLSLSGQALSLALSSGSTTGALSSADWTVFNNKQAQLNGTGFVRFSGTTPSYITGTSSQFVKADGSVDGTSYATAASLSGYLPLSGGTLTGALNGTTARFLSGSSTEAVIVGGAGGVGSTRQGQLKFGDAGTVYKIQGGEDYSAINFIIGAGTPLSIASNSVSTFSGQINGTSLSMSGVASSNKFTNNGQSSFSVLTDGNLSMYASSTIGNVISGAGSTYDISIVNKNGQGVIEVPTGTRNVNLGGTLNGTSLSMSGIGLFNGAVDDGTNKLIVNGGVKASGNISSTAGNITAPAGDLSAGGNMFLSTNNRAIYGRNAANSSDIYLIGTTTGNLVRIDNDGVGASFGGAATFSSSVTGTILTGNSYVLGGYLQASGTTGLLVLTPSDWGTSSEIRNNTTINGASGGDYLSFKNPTGKGFSWTVNGSSVANLSSTGAATFSSSVTAAALSATSAYSVGNTALSAGWSGVAGFTAQLTGTSQPFATYTFNNGNVNIITNNPTISFTTLTTTTTTMLQIVAASFVGSAPYNKNRFVAVNSSKLAFEAGSAERLLINEDGTITAGGSITASSFFESSDSRLKAIIADNYEVPGIELITPKLYKKNGKAELGYFAQDFIGVLDSAVTTGEDGMLSLSYREVMVAKIYALEQEVKMLKEKYGVQ